MNLQKGFTLIEVMIVIVIIAIIISMSPVSSGFYDYTEYETTIRKIIMDMRRFRIRAICDNRTYKFRIFKNDDLYKIDNNLKSDYIFYYIDSDGREVTVYHGEFPAKFTLYKNLDEEIIMDNYYDRISFTGCGTACTGTIGLESPEGVLTKIVVSQLGRIRIEN